MPERSHAARYSKDSSMLPSGTWPVANAEDLKMACWWVKRHDAETLLDKKLRHRWMQYRPIVICHLRRRAQALGLPIPELCK